MASALIPSLAAGPNIPTPPNAIQQAQEAATVGQTRAQTGLVQAQAAGAQAAAQQTQIENTLKQRELDAQKVAAESLQKNSYKNPDGSVTTDFPRVYADMSAAGFPDYALKMQGIQLTNQENQIKNAKLGLDLNTAKTNSAAHALAMGGFIPGNQMDPQTAAKAYAGVVQTATQGGYADKLPLTLQQFQSNTGAAMDSLTNFVKGAGETAAGLQQTKAQIEAKTEALNAAQSGAASLIQQAQNPAELRAAYSQIASLYPEQYASMGLPPLDTVRTPEDLAHVKALATQAAISDPAKRQELQTQATNVASEVALRKAQAAAEAAAAAASNAAATLTRAQTYSGYGAVNPATGEPSSAASPANQPANGNGPVASPTAPIIQVPGKSAPVDLSKDPNWFRSPPGVQMAARNLLQNGNAGAPMDRGTEQQAIALANKIDPQWQAHAAARAENFAAAQPVAKAMRTAVEHSAYLGQLAETLNQQLPRFLNTPVAKLKDEFGSEATSEFNNVLDKYKTEVARYNEGSSHVSVDQNNHQAAILDTSKTVGQVLRTIQSNNRLMASKADVIERNYNVDNGGRMFGGEGLQMLDPRSKAIVQSQGGTKKASKAEVQNFARDRYRGDIGAATRKLKSLGYQIEQ